MERPYPSVEFESTLNPDGTLRVPGAVARRLRAAAAGARLTVRLTAGSVPGRLRARSVDEGEVERIALLQREGREHVLAVLRAEGALAAHAAFRSRARALFGRRRA